MTFKNMNEKQRRDFWTGYKELLTPLREKGATNMRKRRLLTDAEVAADIRKMEGLTETARLMVDTSSFGSRGEFAAMYGGLTAEELNELAEEFNKED